MVGKQENRAAPSRERRTICMQDRRGRSWKVIGSPALEVRGRERVRRDRGDVDRAREDQSPDQRPGTGGPAPLTHQTGPNSPWAPGPWRAGAWGGLGGVGASARDDPLRTSIPPCSLVITRWAASSDRAAGSGMVVPVVDLKSVKVRFNLAAASGHPVGKLPCREGISECRCCGCSPACCPACSCGFR